jgi:pimeloyl-ACP methyl ester carboxylesterase
LTSTVEVAANGWTFTARTDGPEDGRPVILLHGFPQTSRCFTAELSALGGAGFRAVAPDQRGYSPGARPTAVEAYRVEELASDVVALADSLGFDTFDLVGHDWGGLVAWIVASRWPGRVRTLTSVSTPHPLALADALGGGDPDQAERSSYLKLLRQTDVPEELLLGADGNGEGLRALFADSGIDADTVEEYIDVLSRPGALTAALNWYRANDLRGLNGPEVVIVPTLYVWSTEDIALGRVAAEATADHVTGPYRFEVLEGVSHWIPDVAADRLNPLLLDHFAAHA